MHALRVLEFDLTLETLSLECETALGAEWARELRPGFDAEEVWRQLGLTREADMLLAREALPGLAQVHDVRTEARKAQKGAVLDGETLYRVGEALAAMRGFRAALRGKGETARGLAAIGEGLFEQRHTEQAILDALEPDGEMRDSASPELARLRKTKRQCVQRIQERINSYVSGKSREWLSDAVVTQRDGRYVVPLKSEHRGKIRGVVHDTSSSGQTLFIEPEDVLQLGNALREAEAAEKSEVARVLGALSSLVGRDGAGLAGGVEAAATLDLILAKARHGQRNKGCIPEPLPAPGVRIRNGRHPLLAPGAAVPLSIEVGVETDCLLITGPNTGGKTVAIKTVGLHVLMAQSGMMPPAEAMHLGVFSQVWADIGDEQSLAQSLSTFSGHVRNISRALRELRPGALVLLDEIGAGTDPAEGAALAKAVLLSLQRQSAKVLASTHYGELKVFAYSTPGFANAAMEFDLKTLSPTFRLMPGAPGASHALRIAERCGMPAEVVALARDLAGVEQQDLAAMLEKLEASQKQAQRAQSEADRLAARLRHVEKEAEAKLRQAEEARRTAKTKVAGQMEEALRELRLQAQQVFDGLKADSSPKALGRARQRLREIDQAGRDWAAGLRPETMRTASAGLRRGDKVRVEGHGQVGTLLEEPKGGQARVLMGVMKMTVALEKLTLVQDATGPAGKARESLTLRKALEASTEVNLIQMRAEDAQRKLEKFLDDALLAGFPSARVVHGKGEGVLRTLVREVLRKHPGVARFRQGEPAEGGGGITIVEFA
jgi:DNA mismatch repair protein MutS2